MFRTKQIVRVSESWLTIASGKFTSAIFRTKQIVRVSESWLTIAFGKFTSAKVIK